MRDRLLAAEKVKAIDWRDDALYLLDQRILPFEENWLAYTGVEGVAQAIRDMAVRGAPAIGIAAAYGVVLAARVRKAAGGDWLAALEEDLRSGHPGMDAGRAVLGQGWPVTAGPRSWTGARDT